MSYLDGLARTLDALEAQLNAPRDEPDEQLIANMLQALSNLEDALPSDTGVIALPSLVRRGRELLVRVPEDARSAFLRRLRWRLIAIMLLPGSETPELLREVLRRGDARIEHGRTSITHASSENLVNAMLEMDASLLIPALEEVLVAPADTFEPPDILPRNFAWWIDRRRCDIVSCLARLARPACVHGLILALSAGKKPSGLATAALISLAAQEPCRTEVLAELRLVLERGAVALRVQAAQILAGIAPGPDVTALAQARTAAERVERVRTILASITAPAPSTASAPSTAILVELPDAEATAIELQLVATHGAAWEQYQHHGPQLVAIAARWIAQSCQDKWKFRHQALPHWEALLRAHREHPGVRALAITPFRFLQDESGWDGQYGPTVHAVDAFDRVFGDDPASVDVILAHLRSGSSAPRNALIRWLQRRAPEHVTDLLLASLESTLALQRNFAVVELAALPALPLAALLVALSSSNAATRRAAAEVFEKAPTQDALAAIETALARERSGPVRTVLVRARDAARARAGC